MKNQHFIPLGATILMVVAMSVALICIAIPHTNYLATYPLWLPSIGLSIFAGIALVFANLAGIRLPAVLIWIGYGAASTLIAFALQSIINGSFVQFFGPASITHPIPALILGIGASVCQTFGKYAGIRIGMLPPESKLNKASCLAIGLGIGLGFGICETFLLAIQQILNGVPVESLVGALERASANGFHIYSAGLIAVGLSLRSAKPIVLVLTLHAGMDGFSTAFGHRVSLWLSESIFFLMALATWGCWIAASKRILIANREI